MSRAWRLGFRQLSHAIGEASKVCLLHQVPQLLRRDGRLEVEVPRDVLQQLQHGRHLSFGEQVDLQVRMAAYGTLVAWAQAMGHRKVARLLQETLDEEKAADEKLSGLAEGGIDQSAADTAHPDEGDGPMAAGTGRKGSSTAKARRR